jgi:hypothetical protein
VATPRYDEAADCYVVLVARAAHVERPPARWEASREVWIDRATLRATRVRVFAPDGRVAVDAALSGHAAVGDADGYVVPREVSLSFPTQRATMRLRLRDVVPLRNGLPSDVSFRFPANPGVARVSRIDEDCGE